MITLINLYHAKSFEGSKMVVDARIEDITKRLEHLENEFATVKQQLRKKAEEHKLKLKEKFDIHDHSRNLLSEFEAMRIEDTAMNAAQINELKTIVKCFVELVDSALGVDFP
jgi:predicted nuclease with TOPRIM domain